ncbi:MAG: N-acetylglucosamine-6-phosphate deacetylase [PVC group bacterium]
MTQKQSTAIINAVILRPGFPPSRGGLLVVGDRIERLFPEGVPAPEFAGSVIDARGDYLVPGFIDLHVHGGGGDDFNDNGGRMVMRIINFLARFGTTAALPTIATPSRDQLLQIVRTIAPFYWGKKGRGRVLGINLEGPYLSIGKRGAQPLRFIRNPSGPEVEELLEAAEGSIKIMTLAPEVEGALRLIRLLKHSGVIPAIGHTTADYETTRVAIRAGLSYATHVFNSYPPLHHRHPGAVGAVLESDPINVELLCDGIHLSPVIVKLVSRLKPLERLLLVTDGIAVLGRRIKKFMMGGREAVVDDNGAHLPDGTLVGSTVPMNHALRNFTQFTGCSLSDALMLATGNPARLLGIEDRKGDIRRGMDADLVVMDRHCAVKRTIIAGETVYRKP